MTAETSRDAVLNRLRSALRRPGALFRDGTNGAARPDAPGPVVPDPGHPALEERFVDALRRVSGDATRTARAADAAEVAAARVQEWIERENAARQVLAWDRNELDLPDLEERLTALGIAILTPRDLHDVDERHRAASVAVGITGVDAAVASTGTMIFVPRRGRSRGASLLPRYHLALIPASRIVANVESWLAGLRANGEADAVFRERAQVVMVTGPSKSADIELNLTLGVHGPKIVHAVIWPD